jgi:hypothetical protein
VYHRDRTGYEQHPHPLFQFSRVLGVVSPPVSAIKVGGYCLPFSEISLCESSLCALEGWYESGGMRM